MAPRTKEDALLDDDGPFTDELDHLNPQQQRFVDEYLIDLDATHAAIRAGYSARSASQIGYQLLQRPSVAAQVRAREAARAERLGLSQDWVIEQLRNVYARSMEPEAVRNKKGRILYYRFDSAGANKSLELMGKHTGMFGGDSAANVTINNVNAQQTLAAVPPEQLLALMAALEADIAARKAQA